jgi:hypothetical protein
MDWKAYRPALMHRCRDAKHPHSLPMESTSSNSPKGITLEPTKMANVPAEVQEITNGHW